MIICKYFQQILCSVLKNVKTCRLQFCIFLSRKEWSTFHFSVLLLSTAYALWTSSIARCQSNNRNINLVSETPANSALTLDAVRLSCLPMVTQWIWQDQENSPNFLIPQPYHDTTRMQLLSFNLMVCTICISKTPEFIAAGINVLLQVQKYEAHWKLFLV